MKKLVKKIIDKNYFLSKWVRKVYVMYRKFMYNIKNLNVDIDNKSIMFESYNGRNVSCTPKRLLQLIREDENFLNYKKYIVVRDIEKYKEIYSDKNTSLIKFNSKEYYEIVAKSKYIITNSRLPKYINIKKEQVYVQCWHGTPLKRLGADIIQTGRNGIEKPKDTAKSFEHEGNRINYFVSPSKYASDKFITAFRLDKLGKQNCIAETGYPRNDFLINFKKEDVKTLKNKFGIDKNKRIILYAPTWRDNEYTSEDGYIYNIAFDLDRLYKKFGKEYQILLRTHYFISNSINYDKYKGFVIDVSKADDINEIYVISDMLITDYSSVFFDFATLKRPIVFYMYDKEEYANDIRGFYLDLDELPGVIIDNQKDLEDVIENSKIDEEKQKAFINKFCYLDDGKAGQRLIKQVFNNE